MEFSDNKPIYRQIAEHAFNLIIEGIWPPGQLIPSVRELSAEMGVNTRTVMKAMEHLQAIDVIHPKRGMGFVLAENAGEIIKEERKKEFFQSTLPNVASEMKRLGITKDEVFNALSGFLSILLICC